LQYFLRLVALVAMRAKFDVLPSFIWLLGEKRLVSATIGRSTAIVAAVALTLNRCSQAKTESSLQHQTASINF